MRTESIEYINFDGLRDHVSGYDALFNRLLSLLLEQAPQWIEELDHAFASGESDLVRRVCHKIKGSAGVVHAKYIVDAAVELGGMVGNGGLAEAQEGKDRLVRMIKNTVAYVQDSGYI